jgi:hypothetical protein
MQQSTSLFDEKNLYDSNVVRTPPEQAYTGTLHNVEFSLMNFVLNNLKESVTAVCETSVDAGLKDSIVRLANQHKVLPTFEDLPFVRSPLLKVLEDSYAADTTGMSHVLYAEPSTGKTSACRIFVEKVMVDNNAPALMISGQAVDHDYFAHVATLLGSKKPGYDWVTSLIAALRPDANSERAHAVLILDEFNYEGPDCINMKVAEALFRQIYNNAFGFTLIFVTQNKTVADNLCSMNKWQKIGPLPGLTRPGRWEVDEKVGPPEHIPWLSMDWPLERLTVMILQRFPLKFDMEVVDNKLPWLTGISRPTRATEKATAKLSERRGERATASDLP